MINFIYSASQEFVAFKPLVKKTVMEKINDNYAPNCPLRVDFFNNLSHFDLYIFWSVSF